MRPCTALRGSNAIPSPIRVHTTRQLYSSNARAASQDHDAIAESPVEDSETNIDHHGKTIKTAVGDLPLSPVMDSTFWEARDRFRHKKPRPGKPGNVFEREFRKNPFAQALATPVRLDGITKLRMPAFFFQDFNLVAHPETDQPWWVPKSFATPPTALNELNNSKLEDGSTSDGEANGCANGEVELASTAGGEPMATSGEGNVTVCGPTAYVLARQKLLRSFQDRPKGKKQAAAEDSSNAGAYRRLLAFSSSTFKGPSGRAVWRQDMDEFVLRQMRHQVVQDLVYLSKLCEMDSRYYIVKCFGWEDIKFKHKGAVLWFGGDAVEPDPFATFDVTNKTSVLVHNIPMLLGRGLADRVLSECSVLKDGSIFMLAGRRTTDLQLKLWKLQGYLGQ